MKNRIIYILLFAYLLLAFVSHIIIYQNNVWQNKAESLTAETTLFIGNQRMATLTGKNTVTNANCFAGNKLNYAFQYYFLKKYLKSHQIKTLVLQTDLEQFTFSEHRMPQPAAWWVHRVNYFELSKSGLGNEYKASIEAWIFPYAHFFRKTGKEINDLSLRQDAKHKIDSRFYEGFYIDYQMLSYFEKILNLMEQNHVKVILISLPYSKDYLDYFSKTVADISEFAKVDLIIEKYNNIIAAFGYQDMFVDHPEYFKNADELNTMGAKEFRKNLQTDIDAI